MIKQGQTLFLILLSLLTVNCQKEITSPDSDVNKIFGEWEWIRTTSSWGMNPFTPESAGYKLKLKIAENGTLKKYKNGIRIEKVRFSSARKLGNEKILISPMADEEFTFNVLFEFRGQDTMLSTCLCDDAGVEIYKRLK